MTDTLTAKTLAMTEVALTVTTLLPDALDAEMLTWPAERVAEFAIRAAQVARIAAQAKTVAYARLVQMEATGDLFRDPVDQRLYRFTGGRHRKVRDIAGLLAQLDADGVKDVRSLAPWLASDAIKVSESIDGDSRIKEAVREFAAWIDDPLSLVEIDETTMKPVRR